MFTPGLRACAYKSASGRGNWPNKDPLGEFGFETLRNPAADEPPDAFQPEAEDLNSYQFTDPYGFVMNSPIDLVDTDGRNIFTRGWNKVTNWFKGNHNVNTGNLIHGNNWTCEISAGSSGARPDQIGVKVTIGWPGPLNPPKKGPELPAPPRQ